MAKKKKNKETIYDVIYDIVRAVPEGRITTYGAVAAAIGAKSGARLVGYAMNNCAYVLPPVPAHRVVNRKGLLSGKHHFTDVSMKDLLEQEGVRVVNEKIVEFESVFWDPLKELIL